MRLIYKKLRQTLHVEKDRNWERHLKGRKSMNAATHTNFLVQSSHTP